MHPAWFEWYENSGLVGMDPVVPNVASEVVNLFELDTVQSRRHCLLGGNGLIGPSPYP